LDENVGGVYTLYMCVAGGVKITLKCCIRSLEHLCPLVGILITMSSMRYRTRYSATCVSTGRVGAIVGLCGKSLALMHDGELGSAVAFLVCLILLSCCYTTFSTTQLEASKEVKNDSR